MNSLFIAGEKHSIQQPINTKSSRTSFHMTHAL